MLGIDTIVYRTCSSLFGNGRLLEITNIVFKLPVIYMEPISSPGT